jgi:site-specific DNA-methyltransferase (adenine-specific)
MLERNHIYGMDCIDGMRDIPDRCIDLCVTSPPYKDADGYSDKLMIKCFAEVWRVLHNDSLFFLNFGHLAEDKFRPFRVCELAMWAGFKLNDTITWVKRQYRPLQGHKRLNNLSEFIFLMYKGKMPDLNRKAIGVPHEDKSNVKRWGKDWKCASNVWTIGYETIQSREEKLHNDRFPVELPRRCIKLSGIVPRSVVLDPFMGSFTTAVAAKELGMYYTGFELNDDMWHVGMRRIGEL